MAALAWPTILKPTNVGFWLQNATRSGGVALNGQEQTVGSAAERWRARYDLPIRNSAQILSVRAFLASLDGRAGEILLPAYEGKRANWPIDIYGRVLKPNFTRQKQLDGTAYADPEIPSASAISATVNAAVAIGVTRIAIRKTQGAPFKAGQLFSIANRLYVITRLVSGSGLVTTVDFRPRLRIAAAVGNAVHFARPVATMKMAQDENELMLQAMASASLTLDFVEAF